MASAVLSPSPRGGPQPPRPHPGQSHPAPSVASVTTSPSCSHFTCSSQLCSHAPHSSCPLNSQLGDGQTTMGCGGCPLRAATQSQWRGDHLTCDRACEAPEGWGGPPGARLHGWGCRNSAASALTTQHLTVSLYPTLSSKHYIPLF